RAQVTPFCASNTLFFNRIPVKTTLAQAQRNGASSRMCEFEKAGSSHLQRMTAMRAANAAS
ncbi:hypothetical protein, partial [Ruegeria sp.]|uniref:hypothetical protein n=1 Tax=Ruegeria sp. TaxID=1879320 RepID=UPI00230B5082